MNDRFDPDASPAKPFNRWVVITLGALVLASGVFFTWLERRAARAVMHDTMLAQALMLTAAFDVNKIAALSGTAADLASPDYHYLRNQLIRIRNTNSKYRYLYFFGRRDGQPPFFFMGTAAEGSADYSPPGQVYFEDSPTLNQVFATRSPAISPPFTDRWGTWVSALIPVCDSQSGALLAVFGMDVDVKDWRDEILRRSMMPVMVTCLIIILMGVGMGYLRRRQLAGHIVALRQAQAALSESEALFRLQFELGNIGIAITSPEKGWLRANARLCEMLGYAEPELLQKNWAEMTHPDDLAQDLERFNRMMAGGSEGYEMDKRFFRKDGSVLDTHLTISCHRHPDRSVKFVVASLQDITERKRAEAEKEKLNAQLLQAQKMEAVGHLAGGIAHDFNNMLSVVIGHTEMALLKIDPDDPLHGRLRTIHDAALRSADLVRKLLAFARKQTISPRVLDINDTISGMLAMLRRLIGEDIDLSWAPGEHLSRVRIDPSQIDQILANLMVNARDAIAGVGKITIETRDEMLDEAYCSGHPGFLPGRYVALAVSDSGCGMDSKTVAKIFDPFFTTKALGKGTGLGLATVYGIAKQNDGFINVYSEPGEGTTFRLYLPVVDAPKELPDAGRAFEASGGTGTVLMVEDDAAILELGQAILEQLGYTVLTAGTPEQAIELARVHGGGIDLLITDVVMPQMDGRELVRRIEEMTPGLKCLYISGYTANVIAHHGVLDPGVNFLQKPFSIHDIAVKIREVIES
ncbi:MAG: PAS domain S-box protein [Pseudomonadota bacterium]